MKQTRPAADYCMLLVGRDHHPALPALPPTGLPACLPACDGCWQSWRFFKLRVEFEDFTLRDSLWSRIPAICAATPSGLPFIP